MPEWRVGRYRRLAIRFRDQRYMLVEAEPAHGGHRYALAPWPLVVNELASQEIVYDEAYVREREADVVLFRKRQRQAWALMPALPFLGFLPQSTKGALREHFGLEPIASTRRSVIMELIALVFLFIFTVVRGVSGLDWLTMTIGGGGELRDILVILFFTVDLGMRCGIFFDDEYEPYGFFEWIAHPDSKEHFHRVREALKARRERRAREAAQSDSRK